MTSKIQFLGSITRDNFTSRKKNGASSKTELYLSWGYRRGKEILKELEKLNDINTVCLSGGVRKKGCKDELSYHTHA